MKTVYLFILYFFLPMMTQSQHISFIDEGIPSTNQVVSCLLKLKSLSTDSINCNNIIDIYRANVNVGKYIRCFPLQEFFLSEEGITYFSYMFRTSNYGRDSSIIRECLSYIRQNKEFFREVSDGWKGEENFWEPARSFYLRIHKLNESCPNLVEIQFDLDFKDFIRRYDIDLDAKGKSCDQYFKEFIKEYGDQFRESGYTDEDMKQWTPDCEEVREQFKNGRKALLDKYHNASFTKILQDIDETTIVIFHSNS